MNKPRSVIASEYVAQALLSEAIPPQQRVFVPHLNEAIVEHTGLLRPTTHTPPIGLAMTQQKLCVIPAYQLWIEPRQG